MAERMPDTKFVPCERGGHLLFDHQKELQEIITNYIEGSYLN